MARFEQKAPLSPWKEARKAHAEVNEAYGSMQGLSDDTGIDRRRIGQIEAGTLIPTPSEARIISLACDRPELQYYYCSNLCPLGRNLPKVTEQSPELTAIQLAASCGKLIADREKLLDIMADGVVDEAEYPIYQQIVEDIKELIGRYKTLEADVEKRMRGM